MINRTDWHEDADHQRSCVLRNKRLALLSLMFSLAMLVVCFRELYRPFASVRVPVSVILVILYGIGLMALSAVRTRCSHERLWLGVAVAAFVVLFVIGWFPGVVAPEIKVIRILDALLWLVGTVVSIRFVRSAFRGEE